jgi:predicted NBD/HSP70 family sugar kinase
MLDKTALYLGVSVADLINLFNPEWIILGGRADLLIGEYMLPASVRRRMGARSGICSPRPRSSLAA